MIVRIMGKGQFELPERAEPFLEELDAALLQAVEDDDEAAFQKVLGELMVAVRRLAGPPLGGTPRPSELVLPGPGTTAKEIRGLLMTPQPVG